MVAHDVLPLSLSLRREQGWSVLGVSGQVSLTTRAELAGYLGRLAAVRDPARIVVDVSQVAVCDAVGLGVLWAAYVRAARRPVEELRLVSAQGRMLRILEVSGVGRAVRQCSAPWARRCSRAPRFCSGRRAGAALRPWRRLWTCLANGGRGGEHGERVWGFAERGR